MTKNIIKETAIILLLLVVIILIFGIIFYDYIPTNKIAPAKVQAYELAQDVQNELADTLSTDSQNIVKTYYIDSSDLSLYESTNDYAKGKQNPFTSYKATIQSNNVVENTVNSIGNATNTNSQTTNTTTPGTFFNNTGKNQ